MKLRHAGLLALLAGITVVAWINYTEWRNNEASKQTILSLRESGLALEAYRQSNGGFGRRFEGSLEQFSSALALDANMIARDGWGRPFQVLAEDSHYVVWSRGSDGRDDARRSAGKVQAFSGDLVFADGVFWTISRGISAPEKWSAPDPFEKFSHGNTEPAR